MPDLARYAAPLRLLMQRLRLATGLVLFLFVVMHLTNHAMLLVGFGMAERMRPILMGPWTTLPGEILLYGSLLFHVLLALWTLYSRPTLLLPPAEMVQLLFGLLIPFLLADHIVSTGIGRMLYGSVQGYGQVLRSMWADNAALGLQQMVAVIVVWTHACIGIAHALRDPRWPPSRAVPLLILAVLLPVLALVGFAGSGRTMALYGPQLNPLFAAEPAELRAPAARHGLSMIETSARGTYVLLIGLVLLLRQLRTFLRHASGIDIGYRSGARVHVAKGTSILEASRINGIAHYSVCGGNGRCSTCRVRILSSSGALPPPGPREAATLKRIGAPADVRLACQLRPLHDVEIERVLIPPPEAGDPIAPDTPPQERSVAILFCDLRGFTAYSEAHLPYDVVFLLNRYFQSVGDAVKVAGGRVDKFIGDGAMAIFGLDSSYAEACRGALRAAALIRSNIAALNREFGKEVDLKLNAVVGIHAGPAIVGEMGIRGTSALTAVGDTVNVASRLEAVAKETGAAVVASAEVMEHSGLVLSDLTPAEIAIQGRRSTLRVYMLDERMVNRRLI